MATWSNQSENSASWSNQSETEDETSRKPIGLLLALTYPAVEVVWSNQSENSANWSNQSES